MSDATIRLDRVALNPLQWINVKADPTDPDSDDLWRYADPDFRYEYPGVLSAVRESGFPAVMMEVLSTQTLQDYGSMVVDAGLALAPGYASIGLPESHDAQLEPGTGCAGELGLELLQCRGEGGRHRGRARDTAGLALTGEGEPVIERRQSGIGAGDRGLPRCNRVFLAAPKLRPIIAVEGNPARSRAHRICEVEQPRAAQGR